MSMKALKEMILESNEVSRAYTTWFEKAKDAINFIRTRGNSKTRKVPVELIEYLYSRVENVMVTNAPVIFNDAGEIKFRQGDRRTGIIGIESLLVQKIKDVKSLTITKDAKGKIISIDKDTDDKGKITISHKDEEKKCTVEVGGGVPIIFAFGAGSAKGVNISGFTKLQETASCIYINKRLNNEVWSNNDILKFLGNKNEELPNPLIVSWLPTFPAQFETLKANIHLTKNHIFFRVGDTRGWDGAKRLEAVRTKFKQIAKFNQINILDPSDIYCVDLGSEDKINELFKDVLEKLNEDNYFYYLHIFKRLFKERKIFGVSLKKVGSNGYNFQINNIKKTKHKKIKLTISKMDPEKLTSSNKSLIIQTGNSNEQLVFRTKHGKQDSCILEFKSNIILGSVSRQLYMDELNKYNFTNGHFDKMNFLNGYAKQWQDDGFVIRFTKLYNDLYGNWKIKGADRDDVLNSNVSIETWKKKFNESKKEDSSLGKIFSYIQQILFLNAINNAYIAGEGDQLINKFMLLAEKIGDKNLPYILLEPK